MTARRFELHRDADISGVSGTGVVAEGLAFSDGVVSLRWIVPAGQPGHGFPTSVVFHDNGVESVEKIHGHSGATRIVWLDPETDVPAAPARTGNGAGYTSTASAAGTSDYEALAALAEAATPGPWSAEYIDEEGYGWTIGVGRAGVVATVGEVDACETDAAFIAAANPTTVLALIAEIKRLRSLRDNAAPDTERAES